MPDQPQPNPTLPSGSTQVLFAPDNSGVQLVTSLAPGIALVQTWPREQIEGLLKELVRRQMAVTPEEMTNLLKVRDLHA